MERASFLESIKVESFKTPEVIDDVIVVQGTREVPRRYKTNSDGKIECIGWAEEKYLEMYDKNGNRFYENYSSVKEAEEAIEKLKAEGKEAVIGPKAPVKDDNDKLIPNTMEGAVGVYIVKTIEEKEESKDDIELS